MLVTEFNTNFETYIQDQKLEEANNALLKELARILVEKKQDFIDMLEESGIEADETMSKPQLIELFTENTDNKKLLLGASLLANSYNQSLSFDGSEAISDDNVKVGYAVLNENFNGDEEDEVEDEEFSYIAPLLAGLVKGGVSLWRNNRRNQGKSDTIQNEDFNRVIAKRRELARRNMERQAIQRQQVMLQQQQMAQAEAQKRRRRTNTYIIIGVTALLGIIGTVAIVRANR
jgi:hypothetical protein